MPTLLGNWASLNERPHWETEIIRKSEKVRKIYAELPINVFDGMI